MKSTRFSGIRRFCTKTIELQSHRKTFENASLKLKFTSFEDWYKFNNKELISQVPSLIGPLKYFGDSLPKALATLFSEYKWKPWKFKRLPPNFWKETRFHREFTEDLKIQLGFKNWEDWYKVKYWDIVNNGGRDILKYYNNSVLHLIRGIYPEYPFKVWRFHLPAGHWRDPANQRSFFDEVGKEIGIEKFEDWYEVKISSLQPFGISLVSDYFGGSVSKALMHLYPEYDWKIWKFNSVPNGFWQDIKNQRAFFDDIAKKFNINGVRDWLQIRHVDIIDHGGRGLMKIFNDSPLKALASAYPEKSFPKQNEDWRWIQNAKNISKAHFQAFNAIQELFPPITEIFVNFLLTKTEIPLEIDIFLPNYNLGFEYHGKQHYESKIMYQQLDSRKQKDDEKKKQCEEVGVTIIEIPYWWDGSRTFLLENIIEKRPELKNVLIKT